MCIQYPWGESVTGSLPRPFQSTDNECTDIYVLAERLSAEGQETSSDNAHETLDLHAMVVTKSS